MSVTSAGSALELPSAEHLVGNLSAGRGRIAIIGLGYVGLPLALAFWTVGGAVLGFDIDEEKVGALRGGRSYIQHIGHETVRAMVDSGRFHPTGRIEELAEAAAILICVPTPLTHHREPDLGYIIRTAEALVPVLRPGQLIVLESTTYPGTTAEVLVPILERGGLKSGRDFFVAFSPEREDPGNPQFRTADIPKVIGADDETACRMAAALYGRFTQVVPVASLATAEAVKLTENIFRAVNIALANELKLVFERMGVDVWEVVDAAKTKPFGFMPFYPGPGIGGHCIPVDPFYLTWKAREYDVVTRFIELAGEINAAMPEHVVNQTALQLSDRLGLAMAGARILVMGVAYKKNVDDLRESPSLRILRLLGRRGARVNYYDPHVPRIGYTREYKELAGMESQSWRPELAADYDAILICTDHDAVDYEALGQHAPLIIDTRNAMARVTAGRGKIVKA